MIEDVGMKTILTIALVLVTQIALAGNVANYSVSKGKLHSGGKARVEINENSPEKFIVNLNYEIYKKILVPIPEDQLKGETLFELPPEFRDERGYMELQTKGIIELEKATLKFVKRVKWKNFNDAYQVIILPKNGKSKVEVIFHPSVSAAGWANIVVTFINNIPIFNGYQIVIDIF